MKALFITKKIKPINKKEIITVAINKNFEIFVIYILSIIETILKYLAKKAQIAAVGQIKLQLRF